jgi:hypothetical protein
VDLLELSGVLDLFTLEALPDAAEAAAGGKEAV